MRLLRLSIVVVITSLAADFGVPALALPASDGGPGEHRSKGRGCKAKERPKAEKRRPKRCKRKKTKPQPSGQQAGLGTGSSLARLQLDTDPALFPAFAPEVSDYVTRCDGVSPVSVSVAAGDSSVSVDGSEFREGAYTVSVPLEEGQAFVVTEQPAEGSDPTDPKAPPVPRTYHVRCLPSDFPSWSFDRLGGPNNELYLVDPSIRTAGPITDSQRYTIGFDNHGVPIWWFKAGARPIDSKVLSDGTIAFKPFPGGDPYEIRGLDGILIETVGIVGGATDNHDLQELPNGNYLVLEYRQRTGADYTACGGPASTTVVDAVIQEVDPDGNLIWEWNSKDHIAVAEMGRWCAAMTPPIDIAHINSVEPDGSSLIISLRHTDAIYKLDRATGAVLWKLGGTPTPQSLQVLNDPDGDYPFGGQHDARVQPDGTITIHDNATGLMGAADHAPRAVRYAIDEGAMTATLLESITDPEVDSSFCCGGTRRSPSGAWVMSWGGNGLVTEFGPDGSRTFRLTFPDTIFSYRVFPVPPGQLTRPALRAGMDAQFPRP